MDDLRERLQQALGDAYVVERELGGGGMSRVFVARDVALERAVAVKVLPPELAAAVSVERFRREIRLAARLQHPHIVPLLATGEAEGLLYYTMPLVTGQSLRATLAGGELPIPETLRILREVTDALALAHEQGVVHRDLKPENILLSGEHALVTDFGVAKALTAASGTETMTATGVSIGTPAYMAPEQIAADPSVDARADLYALGVLAYEMLAGQPPFAGSAPALFAAHMTLEPPSLAARRPSAPPRLVALVERCLAKRPADRPQTAREMLEEVRAIEALVSGARSGETAATRASLIGAPSMDVGASAPAIASGTRGAPRARTHRPLAIAAGVIALVALGAGAYLRGGRSTVVADAEAIAVLPFVSPSGDSTLARTGRDLVVTVSASLDGVGGLRVSDPLTLLAQLAPGAMLAEQERQAVGARVGARSVVHGTLVRQGDVVRADITIEALDEGGARVLGRTTATAAANDVGALSDSVTWSLLRVVWRRGDLPTPTLAGVTTRSLPALRAYLDGEAAMVANQWEPAEEKFREAIALDSTFWMAHWRRNFTLGWMVRPADTASVRKVRANLAAFPERDRLLIEASFPESLATRLERYREVARRYPDSWFVALRLADQYTHFTPFLGTTRREAIAALEEVVRVNPRLQPALSHLAWLAGAERDTARLRQVLDIHERETGGPFLLDGPPADAAPLLRAAIDWHRGDTATALETIRRVNVGAPGQVLGGLAMAFYFTLREFDLADRVLDMASERMVAEGMPAEFVVTAKRMTDAFRGDWQRGLGAVSDAEIDAMRRAPRGQQDLMVAELASIAAWVGGMEPAMARRLLEGQASEVQQGPPDLRARIAWLAGIIAVAEGDRAAIARARSDVRAAGGRLTADLDRTLEALELGLAGDVGSAARIADSLSLGRGRLAATRLVNVYPGLDVVLHLAAARFTLATGDTTAALRNLAMFDAWALNAMQLTLAGFTTFADYERARIAQAQGRADDARAYYARVLEVYTQPPPAHQAMVRDAREQLARLSGLREPPPRTP